MVVTIQRHSGRDGETRRDDAPGPGRRADGEQSGENLLSQSGLLSVRVVLDAHT